MFKPIITKTLFFSVFFAVSTQSQSMDTFSLFQEGQKLYINEGQLVPFGIPNGTYVQNLSIQAESAKGCTFTVESGGKVLREIVVPPYDPNYRVDNINGFIGSIELRHQKGGSATIRDIAVTGIRAPASTIGASVYSPSTVAAYYGGGEFSVEFFESIESNISLLRDQYTGTDYDNIFLDIKKKATKCRLKLSANSLSSNEFVTCVDQMRVLIESRDAKIDRILGIVSQEDVAANLIEALEYIKAFRR